MKVYFIAFLTCFLITLLRHFEAYIAVLWSLSKAVISKSDLRVVERDRRWQNAALVSPRLSHVVNYGDVLQEPSM